MDIENPIIESVVVPRRGRGRPVTALPGSGELKTMALQMLGALYLSACALSLQEGKSISAIFRDAMRSYLDLHHTDDQSLVA